MIDTDTDNLKMAQSGEKLDKIGRPEKQLLCYWMMQSDSSDNFAANSSSKISHEKYVISTLLLIIYYLAFLKKILATEDIDIHTNH